jgi:hypothetical protein
MITALEKTVEKKGMGRPVLYGLDNPIWETIVEGIADGKSLSSVLKAPNMPSHALARLMIKDNQIFREAYERALQHRADRLAEEILELADEDPPEGLEGASLNAWVQNKRLRVDTRKWIASKLKPKTYGDRIDVSVVDQRISVIDAINEAQARVTHDRSNVTDIEAKNEN